MPKPHQRGLKNEYAIALAVHRPEYNGDAFGQRRDFVDRWVDHISRSSPKAVVSSGGVAWPAPGNPQHMNRVMPNAIFSAGQQQLGTFLLASRGSVTAVADLGALTRLTSIFGIGVNAVAQIAAPRFAKTHALIAMRRLYYGMLALVAAIVVAVLVITFLFPTQILWILGPKYAHLQAPLFLAACLVMLQFAKAVTARMNQAKAWISRTASWNIPLTLGSIGVGLFFFDVSQLNGVLALMLLSSAPMLCLYLLDAFVGMKWAAQNVRNAP